MTGVNDAAGNPFWFNGKVPNVNLNPTLLAPMAGRRATARRASIAVAGRAAGAPQRSFTKPGTYKHFCDVHYGMVGDVVVKPTGVPIPSDAQDAAALHSR